MATKQRQEANIYHTTNPPSERSTTPSVLRYPNLSERFLLHGQLLLPPPSHQRDHKTSRDTHHGSGHSLKGPPKLSTNSAAIHYDSSVSYSMPHTMQQTFPDWRAPPGEQVKPHGPTRPSTPMSRHSTSSSRDEYHTKPPVERTRIQVEQQKPLTPLTRTPSSKQHYCASERNTSESQRLQTAVEKRSSSLSANSKHFPFEKKTLTSRGRNGHETQKYSIIKSESLSFRSESSSTATSKPKISTKTPFTNGSESNSSRRQPPLSSSSVRSREKYRTDHEMDAVTFSFKTGSCNSCGQQIRKRINQFSGTGLFEVPLTIPNRVYKGQCLTCHPFNGVLLEEKKGKPKRKEAFGLRSFFRRKSF